MAFSLDDACLILDGKIDGALARCRSYRRGAHPRSLEAFNRRHAGEARDTPYVDFTYGDDPDGVKCPITSHMRRANPRDSFDSVSSILINSQADPETGPPYGTTTGQDGDEHGIISFRHLLGASLASSSSSSSNGPYTTGWMPMPATTHCPPGSGNRAGDAKFVLAVDPASGQAPFIWSGIPKFVETWAASIFSCPARPRCDDRHGHGWIQICQT